MIKTYMLDFLSISSQSNAVSLDVMSPGIVAAEDKGNMMIRCY